MSTLLTVASAASVLTWLLVAGVRFLSVRWGLYDRPSARSSHVRPTPRLGGVGLAMVLLGGLGVAAVRQAGAVSGSTWWLLGSAGLLVALVSLVDDLRAMPVVVRLTVHLAAAGAVLAASGPLEALVLGAHKVALPAWLGGVVVLLWVAGFINAFNFMDGIDGIAGGQALMAGLGWVLIGGVLNAPALAIAGALVAGSSAGFLGHNWSPASIFMGDAGSALLGFLLSACPLLLGGTAAWVPGLLLVWPFVFDTTLTLMRRLFGGEPVWQAHRSHLYQRLSPSQHLHRRVASLYMGLAGLGGVLALWSLRELDAQAWVVPLILTLVAATLWLFVRWRERVGNALALPSSLEL